MVSEATQPPQPPPQPPPPPPLAAAAALSPQQHLVSSPQPLFNKKMNSFSRRSPQSSTKSLLSASSSSLLVSSPSPGSSKGSKSSIGSSTNITTTTINNNNNTDINRSPISPTKSRRRRFQERTRSEQQANHHRLTKKKGGGGSSVKHALQLLAKHNETYSMERTIAKLEIQNSGLEERLQAQITLNESQQAIIEEQENRISELQDQLETFQKEQSLRNDNLQSRLNEYTKFKTTLPSNNDSASSFFTINTTDEPDTVQVAVESIRDVVDEIQRWLFVEGGNLRDVESLLTEYCKFCRDRIGLPVDRLFIAGMMFPPTISAYVWKWEVGQKFEEHEVPHEAFVKPNYNPDEPFAVLLEGRAMEYRMKGDQNEEIPPGCAWFIENGYQDYFALPIYHRGEFKGAMAWCTKQATGFTQDHIDAFYSSLAALSTVLRLHTNEIVLKTLVEDFGKELKTQTENMQKTNAQLAQANQHILQQSRAQIQHFAMMSHEIRTPLNGIIGISNLLLSRFENDHGDYVYVDDSVRTVEPLDDTGKSTSEFLDDTSKTIESSVDANDDFRESVQMIVSSGDLLLAVVNDVLDYSKLVTGKVETTIEPTNLNGCFRPVLEAIKLKARSNGLNLRTSIDEETVPTHMDLDGRRLQQILYNLLGNAVKFGKQRQGYTNSVDDDHDNDNDNEDDDAHHHHHHRKETIDNNQGYIDFTVTTFVTIKNENEDETKKKDVKDGNDEDHDHDDYDDHDDKEVDDGSSQKNDAVVPSGRSLRISVKDYGKGIAPSEQTKIFEPFQQAATNEATDGGTGLGLAITKLLTEVLGGNISVSSEYGKWSEFVVELPIFNAKKEIGDGAANEEEREEEAKEGRPQRRLSCVSSGAATLPSFPPLTTIDDDASDWDAIDTTTSNNNKNNKEEYKGEEEYKGKGGEKKSLLVVVVVFENLDCRRQSGKSKGATTDTRTAWNKKH